MQTWARRGIQTALVTGGLLMLGTGIASANENVDPDKPVDGSAGILLQAQNNQVATPIGPVNAPNITPQAITVGPSTASGVSDLVPAGLGGVTGSCATDCTGNGFGAHGESLRGNRVSGDLIIPIDVSGNAIAAGGNATTTNYSSQHAAVDRPVITHGHDFLAGNVVDVDWAAPVQITGNAVSVIGNAQAVGTADQSAAATGDIATDGSGGTLAGNVAAGQFATPVQATGNAVSGLGIASADSAASTDAKSGGIIRADGHNGVGTGNVAAAPVAFPAEVNGNAVGGASNTMTTSTHTASATAGRDDFGAFMRPTSAITKSISPAR